MIVTDDLLREFLAETGEHIDTVDAELVRLEQNPGDRAILRNVFRLVHTVKGTCGFLGLPRLEALTHAAETLMERLRDGAPITTEVVTLVLATVDRIKLMVAELDRIGAEPTGSDSDLITELEKATLALGPAPAIDQFDRRDPLPDLPAQAAGLPASAQPQTIRVGIDTLEHLITTVSELVLTRNQLLDVARRGGGDPALTVPLQRLSQVTAELQERIMRTRMQPAGSAWAKLPRLVRDLSAELGKEIELVVSGGETGIDRQVLDIIRDPLTHMVRNCADHGLETPAERRAAGKPEHGTIRLDFAQEGGAISIELSDDGRGLDIEAIRKRVLDMGLATEAELARMGPSKIAAYIFEPGLSTATAVSSVSGRGVGMDVVRSNIDQIGGVIEVGSEPGRGVSFKIRIPLTLAIVAALIVSVGGQRFAMPQAAVLELVTVRPGSDHAIERMNGAALLRLRERLLPVVDLAELLDLRSSASTETGFVMVLQVGQAQFGLILDSVLETEEIVVKPLSAPIRQIQLFSGSTILGDGTVVLIFDPSSIARRLGTNLIKEAAQPSIVTRPAPETGHLMTLLVFGSGQGAWKALPLTLVTRLEEIDGQDIDRTGAQARLLYRGRLIPIIAADPATPFRASGPQSLVIVSNGRRTMGIAVDTIVDIVEARLILERVPGRPDLVGVAALRGRATEIVDLAALLAATGEDWSSGQPVPARPDSVLLVENNPFFRDMLVPVLKAAGYHVLTAGSADEALATVLRERVDAVVVELDLPDRSGTDLVDAMRRRPSTAATTVIALSSAPTADMSLRARDLGIRDVITKFDRIGLLAALAAAPPEVRSLAA